MSKRQMDVGAMVQIRRAAVEVKNGAATFRIEELLKLECGRTLYKVKSDTEPFNRIVAEGDLALRP